MTVDFPVNTTPTTESIPISDHVAELLAVPGSQVNLERRGDRYRLRYREVSADGAMGPRKGLELPQDMALIATIKVSIDGRRRQRRTSPIPTSKQQAVNVSPELNVVLQRILSVCPRGRVVRRRLRLVFRLAAALGYETLLDFIKRKPWLARTMPSGRPRKRGSAKSNF